MANEFKPDWKLDDIQLLQVFLDISLNKNVPGWPGCTDEQLEAVARDVYKGLLEGSTLRPTKP